MTFLADLLADTREYIERHGWWRNALVGPNGKQVCTLGGIYYSQGWVTKASQAEHQPEIREINLLLQQALLHQHPSGRITKIHGHLPHRIEDMSIPEWNDHFAQDVQDVLDTLAKAEKIARAGYDPDA